MPCSQGSPIEVSPRGVPSDPNREAKGSVCSCTIHPTALIVKFGFAISKGTRVWDRLFPDKGKTENRLCWEKRVVPADGKPVDLQCLPDVRGKRGSWIAAQMFVPRWTLQLEMLNQLANRTIS